MGLFWELLPVVGGEGVAVSAPRSPLSLRTNTHWLSCTTQEGVPTAPGLPLSDAERAPEEKHPSPTSAVQDRWPWGSSPLKPRLSGPASCCCRCTWALRLCWTDWSVLRCCHLAELVCFVTVSLEGKRHQLKRLRAFCLIYMWGDF